MLAWPVSAPVDAVPVCFGFLAPVDGGELLVEMASHWRLLGAFGPAGESVETGASGLLLLFKSPSAVEGIATGGIAAGGVVFFDSGGT